MENPVKKDASTILGIVIFVSSIALFVLYISMAAKEKEVIGLKHYYIWGSALSGITLIIMPQGKIIEIIDNFWKGINKKFFGNNE